MSKARVFLLALAAVVVSAVVVAGCGSDSDSGSTSSEATSSESSNAGESENASDESASGEPFRILMVTEKSGAVAPFGAAFEPGVLAGMEIANEEGGIDGHPVEVTFADDQSDPAKGVTALQNALTSGTEYQMVITAITSFTQPLAPLLAESNVIAMSAGSAAALFEPSTKYPNLFGFSANLPSQEAGIVADLKQKGIKSVGVIGPNNEAGMESAELIKSIGAEEGIEATLALAPETVVDATPQLQKLQAANVEALAVVGFSAVANAAFKARTKLGWDVPAYCDLGCAPTDWGSLSAAEREGVLVEQLPALVKGEPETETPTYKAFQKAVAAETDEYPLGIVVDIIPYNMVMAAKAAAEKAGSIEPEALVSTLEEMESSKEVPGYIGPEGLFSSSGELAHVIHSTAEDMIFVPAAPQEDGLMPKGS